MKLPNRFTLVLLGVLTCLLVMDAKANEAVSLDVSTRQRAHTVETLIQSAPAGLGSIFTPQFLEQVPEEALAKIFVDLFGVVGSCSNVRYTGQVAVLNGRGTFRMDCERGFTVEFDLNIESSPPNRIAGLYLKTPVASAAIGVGDVHTASKAFEVFGESVGFIVAELVGGLSIRRLAGGNESRLFKIGSLAKLCTLSAVLSAIDSKTLAWDNILRLQERDKSLPTGALGTWPEGTPLTVQTLMTMLLADSDNTANDLLLRILPERGQWPGRRDDALTAVCGAPPLTTRQYFALRGLSDKGEFYQQATAEERLAILDSLTVQTRKELLERFAKSGDTSKAIGWSASPIQIVNLLARLSTQLQAKSAAPARAVFEMVASQDPFLTGFVSAVAKGGADAGVFAVGLILETKAGRRYAVAVSWNGTLRQPPASLQLAIRALLSSLQAGLL